MRFFISVVYCETGKTVVVLGDMNLSTKILKLTVQYECTYSLASIILFVSTVALNPGSRSPLRIWA